MSRRSTMLVIDDEPSLQQLLRRLLQPQYTVAVAGSGAEGPSQGAMGRRRCSPGGGVVSAHRLGQRGAPPHTAHACLSLGLCYNRPTKRINLQPQELPCRP